MRARNITLELDLAGGTRAALDREAEHIIHTQIGNALRPAPHGSAVKVGVHNAGGSIAIRCRQRGTGTAR